MSQNETNLEKRVIILEKLVTELQSEGKELRALATKDAELENREWHWNTVSDYMIKVFYPGLYCEIKEPKSGFPKNRRKTAEQITPGQYIFVYLTSPVKKVIGLTKVISPLKEVGGQWPYSFDLEWVIGPKKGFTFKELGLDIRPRIGDTLYGFTNDKAEEIIEKLNEQADLDYPTLNYLASEYADRFDGAIKLWE